MWSINHFSRFACDPQRSTEPVFDAFGILRSGLNLRLYEHFWHRSCRSVLAPTQPAKFLVITLKLDTHIHSTPILPASTARVRCPNRPSPRGAGAAAPGALAGLRSPISPSKRPAASPSRHSKAPHPPGNDLRKERTRNFVAEVRGPGGDRSDLGAVEVWIKVKISNTIDKINGEILRILGGTSRKVVIVWVIYNDLPCFVYWGHSAWGYAKSSNGSWLFGLTQRHLQAIAGTPEKHCNCIVPIKK